VTSLAEPNVWGVTGSSTLVVPTGARWSVRRSRWGGGELTEVRTRVGRESLAEDSHRRLIGSLKLEKQTETKAASGVWNDNDDDAHFLIPTNRLDLPPPHSHSTAVTVTAVHVSSTAVPVHTQSDPRLPLLRMNHFPSTSWGKPRNDNSMDPYATFPIHQGRAPGQTDSFTDGVQRTQSVLRVLSGARLSPRLD
jgi:hypothetical protein